MGESTIDHLIICSPYEKPQTYWNYNREKRFFERKEGRRPAGYLMSTGTTSFDDPGIFRELPLVNRIRQRVDAWREKGYPGITRTTKELLQFWRNAQERTNRFFFCQLEAIETIIWLLEAPPSERQGIEIPSDGGAFQRICSKMATGSGKTIVMGMLIAWHTLNKVAYPEDTRFSKNFLVIAPGLTVKKRLQVLDPSAKNSIYAEFNIVPSKKFDAIRQARITIHNWHTLMPLEENPKSVVKKGKESDEAFSRRILGSNHTGKNIIVINDEAHHAWRPKADEKTSVSKEQLEKATRWMEGLDRIHSKRNVLVCHDFSATPFIPTGKGVSEDTLYEWIVSDFSLNDAIESGLVKTPRVAVRDDGRFTRDYHSRFYHIYADPDVRDDLNRKAKPEEPLPDLVKNAYFALGNDWLETKKLWESEKSPVPPVMITVCNTTETAARIEFSFKNNRFEVSELGDSDRLLHIDSKVLKEAENKEDIEDTPKVAKAAQSDEDVASDEDTDSSSKDSEGLAALAKMSRDDRAEYLREVVDTVGKIGKPGQHIQNIIAVLMLSEGWDARTVTHIMGLRAFSSQLLCEQVVGRGLRRTTYDVDEKTGLFEPEYVNVFGIPFTFLPVEGTTRASPQVKSTTFIEPYASKKQYQISWPNINAIHRTYSPNLKLDLNRVESLTINPEDSSLIIDVAPVIDGKPHVDKIDTIDIENKLGKGFRLQTSIFKIARDIYEKFKPDWKGNTEYLLMQIVLIVEEFIQSDKLVIANTTFQEDIRRRALILLNMSKIVQHIWTEISYENTESIKIEYDREKPLKSTSDMMPWNTSKPAEYTKKSHISHAVIDSRWEQNAMFELERNSGVEAWVKNEHLGFSVAYTFGGIVHQYYPDFLIRLNNGVTLVLEIKGEDTEKERTKRKALDQWVKAVNNEKIFGTWAWDVAFSPSEVRQKVNKWIEGKDHDVIENITATCPLCHKEAKGRDQINRLFGYRNMDGFVRVQSWCRDCRRSGIIK